MVTNYKQRCSEIYDTVYHFEIEKQTRELQNHYKNGKLPKGRFSDIETSAQKEAIKQAIMGTMREFPMVEPALIWKNIYEIHVHRKSGIDSYETISKVISADQSWKKSSGHAFEEMVKSLGTKTLINDGIDIILQRDLSILIKAGELSNEPRDISWLKEQTNASVFDLYAIVHKDGKKFCYGCIQSKTSIRDRVTRDREPSISAMQSFFWSVVFVLDGDFLKLPKFITMVNGGTTEHVSNGWHGMYVFSDKYSKGRIYKTDLDFSNFKEHAVEAANVWLNQRQWFDHNWIATSIDSL